MSYHSKLLNIPCTVIMPVTAPYIKVRKCRKFGANVIIHVRLCGFCLNLSFCNRNALTGKGHRWSETLCYVSGERKGNDVHQWIRSSADYCRSRNNRHRNNWSDRRYRCNNCADWRRFVCDANNCKFSNLKKKTFISGGLIAGVAVAAKSLRKDIKIIVSVMRCPLGWVVFCLLPSQ